MENLFDCTFHFEDKICLNVFQPPCREMALFVELKGAVLYINHFNENSF